MLYKVGDPYSYLDQLFAKSVLIERFLNFLINIHMEWCRRDTDPYIEYYKILGENNGSSIAWCTSNSYR